MVEETIPAAGQPAGRKKALAKLLASLMLLGSMVVTLVYNQTISNRAKIGNKLPEWKEVTTLEGKPVKLADFLGKPFVLNLTTTWCISCKREAPVLQAFHERYGDRMSMLAIDIREPVDTVRAYLTDFGITYPFFLDRKSNIPLPYNVRGYPETWFADADGIARKYWEGPIEFEQMQQFYQETTGRPIDSDGVGPVPPGGHAHAVALTPENGGALLVGTHNGLFRGTPAGEGRYQWEPVGQAAKLSGEEVTAVEIPAGARGAVFVATRNLGVLRSRDAGRTWEPANNGLPPRPVNALAASPPGSRLYAWVAGAGLFRSQDGGNTWEPVRGNAPAHLQVTSLALNPRDENHLLLTVGAAVLVSSDGGNLWREVRLKEENFMPQWPGRIDLEPVPFDAAFDPSNPDIVYYATSDGIWKSGDGGFTARWLRESHMRRMSSITASRGADGKTRLAAIAPNGDTYASADGGKSWQLVVR